MGWSSCSTHGLFWVIKTFCLLFISLLMLNPNVTHAEERPTSVVDVEIVLAVDASGSVSRDELQLQLNGIAAAFRDPDVLRAIAQGSHQAVAVAMLIWSDAGYPKYSTQWFFVNSIQTAEIFAAKVENFNRRHGALVAIGGGGTGLGDGLAFALNMLETNGVDALRKVVDVSGDGPETRPWNKGAITLPPARILASQNQTIVNGLAIEKDVSTLTDWYRQNVIVGPGSFAMRATNFHDFTRAIRLKLLREFSPVAIGSLGNQINQRAGG